MKTDVAVVGAGPAGSTAAEAAAAEGVEVVLIDRKAEIGTPAGFSHSASIEGHWLAGAVKRALACAAFRPVFFPISGVQSCPFQSIR